MMNKRFRPVIALGLLSAVFTLAGCQGQEAAPPAKPPAEQTDAAPQKSEAVLDQSGCLTALEGITQYEPGTAGASLKLYTAAAQLTNFTQTFTSAQADALSQTAADYLTGLDASALKAFTSNLVLVDDAARGIISKDQTALDMLEDAGSPQAFDAYDPDRYEAAKGLIDQALAETSCQAALNGVTQYEPGTAGSSLKVYIAAAKLLNAAQLAADSDMSAVTDAYLDALSAESLQRFTDNLPSIDETARLIIQGTDPTVQSMLEDAGSPQAFDHYDPDRYETLKAVIDQSLAQHAD